MRPQLGAYDAVNAVAAPHSYCSSPSGRTADKPLLTRRSLVHFCRQFPFDPRPLLNLVLVGSHAMSPAAAITGSLLDSTRVVTRDSNVRRRVGPRMEIRTRSLTPISLELTVWRWRVAPARSEQLRPVQSHTTHWKRSRRGFFGFGPPTAATSVWPTCACPRICAPADEREASARLVGLADVAPSWCPAAGDAVRPSLASSPRIAPATPSRTTTEARDSSFRLMRGAGRTRQHHCTRAALSP